MDDLNFKALRDFLIKTSGLSLQDDKMYLIGSRLKPVAAKYDCETPEDLVKLMRTRPSRAMETDIVEAMTTNETSFFRDVHPFEAFQNNVLPELIEKRSATKTIRILCAAASSGQEPYSLALVIREHFPQLSTWNVRITGVDIDNAILEKARIGKYSKFEVQRGLPVSMLLKYFDKEEENAWTLKQDVKKLVQFQQLNLLNSFGTLGTFDVIFCRNVLIYFDTSTKTDVLRRLSERLAGDGCLFLGGSETVFGISECFAPRPGYRGIYTPTDSTGATSVRPAA